MEMMTCFLKRANFQEDIISLFKEERIDVDAFMELDEMDFKEMKVTLGDRKKLKRLREEITRNVSVHSNSACS